MTITASLSVSVTKAHDLFAASAAFQDETGGTRELAESRVFYGSAPFGTQRPFVVLDPDVTSQVFAGGSQYHHRPEGTVDAYCERDVPAEHLENDSNAQIEAMQFWGLVLDQGPASLADAADADSEFDETHLAVLTAQFTERVRLNDATYAPSLGRFSMCKFTLTWGDG